MEDYIKQMMERVKKTMKIGRQYMKRHLRFRQMASCASAAMPQDGSL